MLGAVTKNHRCKPVQELVTSTLDRSVNGITILMKGSLEPKGEADLDALPTARSDTRGGIERYQN